MTEPIVNIDYVNGGGQSQGDIANQFMVGGLDPARLRPWAAKNGKTYITVFKGGDAKKPENYQAVPIQTNANTVLRRDEWKQLDETIQKISRERLGGVQDLADNGLVYTLGNAMGTTVLEWHDMSDAMSAAVTMDGATRTQNDTVEFSTNYLPIPIVHSDFEINSRTLEASRRLGNPLNVSNVEAATRKVNEKLEEMLFTDTNYSFGGGTISSYINHGSRNQVAFQDSGQNNWDASAKTPKQIVDDVRAMKQASINAKHYGPWMIYIPTAYETVLDDVYDATRGNTIRQQILQIAGINGVKVVDKLPANNVLLVQMTSDTVQLVRGMGVQTVQWQTGDTMVNKFKIMTIQVPWVRADQAGNSGIVHLS